MLQDCCDGVTLPSSKWLKHPFPDCTVFADVHLNTCKSTLLADKFVSVTELTLSDEEKLTCTLLLKGSPHKKEELTTAAELQDFLEHADRLELCIGAGRCEEFLPLQMCDTSTVRLREGVVISRKCARTVDTNGAACLRCKYARKLLFSRRWRATHRKPTIRLNIRNVRKQLKRLTKKIQFLTDSVKQLKEQTATIELSVLQEKIKSLPPKQQLSVQHCFEAARRKSLKGMGYKQEWMLECILMRMKSPRLYNHLRQHNILSLPGRTTLKKYLRRYKSGFGFNQATFTALREKTADMTELQCHGGLVLDEMKLSENVAVQASGRAEGFVDLGPFTPEEQKGVLADHGMVLLFQPFCGKWTQILGVFASHGNVKADLLAKIIVDAVLLAEQAGLFIDYVCCDAASWNRSMWRQFGIKASSKKTTSKTQHPSCPGRYLHFISDFPHLIKCLRNMFLKTGFRTPHGHAGREHIVEAWKCDSNSLTLRTMPRITHSHLFPNAFEKMRVNLAFHMFSEEVERGLHLYHEQIQGARGNHEGTLQLHKQISTLIRVITSRCPYDALRPGSHQAKFLNSFLDYLDEWEVAAKDGGFVSQSTAEGLRVTLHSTKSLLQYLTTLGYRYLMTARLSQDCIERLFGIIRQSSGPNDHPTPAQFLILANCLSFYNLAKSPTGGCVSKGVLSSLLCAEDTEKTARDQLDALLEAGKLHDVEEALVEDDHASCIEETSDSRLIYYMAGYAARKCITKKGGCGACKSICLRTSTPTAADHPASSTRHFDRGGLLYATDQLFKLISHLEKVFTRCFSRRKLHANSILDILSCVGANVPAVGCGEHKTELTNSIMRFYLITRLHFYVKQKNKMRNQRKKKQQLSKQGRLL